MADYVATLKNDLVEQFRGKANIEALMEVIGAELQQVYDFYDQLRQDRGVHTAVGKQLDGVGDIVVMTRMEAGKLAGDPIPFEVIDDETYRRYLIYKILKNTCDCTYPDIIKAFRMFWDRPLYYKEDPAEPATMIFDTGEMDGTVDTTPLFTTPLLRAAGVTLKLYARTKTEMETAKLYILSGLMCTSGAGIRPSPRTRSPASSETISLASNSIWAPVCRRSWRVRCPIRSAKCPMTPLFAPEARCRASWRRESPTW